MGNSDCGFERVTAMYDDELFRFTSIAKRPLNVDGLGSIKEGFSVTIDVESVTQGGNGSDKFEYRAPDVNERILLPAGVTESASHLVAAATAFVYFLAI